MPESESADRSIPPGAAGQGAPGSDGAEAADPATDFRHDVRNGLNTIKLFCAVLRRCHSPTPETREIIEEIEKAVDGVNEQVTAYTLGPGATTGK